MVLTLPSTSKKHPHNKNLQRRHADHESTLHKTKIPNPSLRTPDRTKIPILPGPEILLLPADTTQKSTNLNHTLLQQTRLLRRTALFRRDIRDPRLVLDRDFKIDQFVGERADRVVEAEPVLACFVGGEDKVALALFAAVEDRAFFAWHGAGAVDGVVDCGG